MDTKTAVVTGASRGLGETLARFLGATGWRVVITARVGASLDAVAAGIPGTVPVAGDVRDPAHRRAVIAAAGARIDLLVNNASLLGGIAPLTELEDDTLLEVLWTNAAAPVALVREALPALRKAGGLVVNVSSDAAVGGYEGWGAYGASKAALDLVSLTLANELRADGVGVVVVDPGDMRTAMHQEAFHGEDISDRPLPDVTVPFWAWLVGQDPLAVSGRRYRAQGESWEVAA